MHLFSLFRGKISKVDLELKLKQYLLLKNDFPMTTPYFNSMLKKMFTNLALKSMI